LILGRAHALASRRVERGELAAQLTVEVARGHAGLLTDGVEAQAG
jgi:hypothetical protein